MESLHLPLPSWLSLNPYSGVLSGTPIVGNSTLVPTITLTASNTTSLPGTATLNLTIQPASVALTTNLIFSEGFESNFPSGWQVGDANTAGVPAYWGSVSSPFGGVTVPDGSRMGYCAGVGYNGTSVSLINAPFTATGGHQSPGQDYMVIGTGVNFIFTPDFSMLLGYQVQLFRNNLEAHFGSVRFGYKF